MKLINTLNISFCVMQAILFILFFAYILNGNWMLAFLVMILIFFFGFVNSRFNPYKEIPYQKPIKSEIIVFEKDLNIDEKWNQRDEKRKIIKELERECPFFKKSNELQKWVKMFNDYNLEHIIKNEKYFMKFFKMFIKHNNRQYFKDSINKNITKNAEIWNNIYGCGIFKYYSPNDKNFAIVKFANENFLRVVHKDKLFEYVTEEPK